MDKNLYNLQKTYNDINLCMFRCLAYHLGLRSNFEKSLRICIQKCEEKYSGFERTSIEKFDEMFKIIVYVFALQPEESVSVI